MRYAYLRIAALIVIASLAAGCAAGRAFGRGEDAARAGDWETAVDHYRRAVDKDPNNAEYRIALERAMISASQVHLDAARVAEARGQLEDALREYRRASEFDPPNRQLAAQGHRARTDAARSDRGGPPAQLRAADARAGAAGGSAAAVQSEHRDGADRVQPGEPARHLRRRSRSRRASTSSSTARSRTASTPRA